MSLSLADISVAYGRKPVLDGIDLAPVAPGSVVGLLGANGAGKSTLLRALAGLLPASGRAELDGLDLLRAPALHRLRQVGYLPQTLPQASPLLAYEAVLGALRATRPDLGAAAAEAAIEKVFAELGLHGLALSRMGQLSGGQRQMVGLAQVLVRQPRLLLLDEPTSALDLRWQLTVLDNVAQMARRQGAIALIAIHDINLAARFCTRLVILGESGIIADGNPAQALSPDILHRAYGIHGRVETCSLGFPMVLADSAAERRFM
ncbi:ABC transporter ATP-binding protein [Magnetospirillum gryphiswaldense]|uniref:ABC transporter ATP-binding protein n=1 Tax=Magnetospirillum gryphiswaldense TaxID=55518 RepID=UPI000D0321F6|nr:ABC transporter ATP-binding protein [Magnetospirillum gryphiswaldense]AVM74282.1 Hemin import ATP-binding protein HmuV [Magnetospirillum gryphiswaldense MSR-1]AVM78185.1 Hemin import ATP-binding protein HmuV [Magnetospirillum gryphiswaldense]